MNIGFEDFFDIIDDVKNERMFTLENIPLKTLAEEITYFHYIKTVSLLDSIMILSKSNKYNESGILLRTLLNLYINIKWLTFDNMEYRMQRYADFEKTIVKKRWDAVEGLHPCNEKEKEKIHFLKKEFNYIVDKYNLNPKKWTDIRQWSGKSISQMAKEVGLSRDYEIIYSILSSIEHSDPSTVKNYINRTADGLSEIIEKPDDFQRALILWTAIDYYYDIEGIISAIFKVSFSEERPNLQKLANKYLNKCIKK